MASKQVGLGHVQKYRVEAPVPGNDVQLKEESELTTG